MPVSEVWCGDHGTSMRQRREIIGKLGLGNLVNGFRGLRGNWDVDRLTGKQESRNQTEGLTSRPSFHTA
jgi:hypothetical protein